MLDSVQYIEPLPNYTVDAALLLNEYTQNIEMNMQPWHGGSDSDVNRVQVQSRFNLMRDSQWKTAAQHMPYTRSVSSDLLKYFAYNRINYRLLHANCAYNWHTDPGQRCLHIALVTNEGARFVYADRAFHLPANGSVYSVNNSHHHTFVNAGYLPRLHITFELRVE